MTRRPSFLKRLLRGTWRGITYLRLALSNLLFLAMLGLLYVLFSGTSPAPLPAKAALLLNPAGTVVDEKSRFEALALLSKPSPATAETRLQDMIEAVDAAATDPRISALVIATDELVQLGLSRSQELAPTLARFRESGKPIIAAADYFTQDQYLLAAEADEIILHPYGGVALQGFANYQNYFREALDKLAVDVHVFRAGEFKSIAEPLTRNDMSDGEKKITQAWLDDLWSQYTARVEERRGLESGAVQRQVNAYPQRLAGAEGDPARLALAEGLVDRLMSRREMDDYIAGRVGAVDDSGGPEMIPFQRYLAKRSTAAGTGRRVAVITAQGNILPGIQDPGAIGAESLSSQLLEVAGAADVGAIVLRINSGGGSVFASEVIRAALAEVREGGTPVVVSMGPVAASGAYFIATAADEIWATPATLTGSIGVFAAFPTVDRLLSRAGIHTDGVGTTDAAGSLRIDRPLNPLAAEALQQSVEQIYEKFLALVAKSRDMSRDEVDTVAQGRVWSAPAAREAGLVDELGSLADAVASAAELAGVSNYRIEHVRPSMSPRQRLLQQFSDRMAVAGLADLLGPESLDALPASLRQVLLPVRAARELVPSFSDPRHLYMQCLVCSP